MGGGGTSMKRPCVGLFVLLVLFPGSAGAEHLEVTERRLESVQAGRVASAGTGAQDPMQLLNESGPTLPPSTTPFWAGAEQLLCGSKLCEAVM